MGTEELLIFRIENDLRKLRNKRANIKELQIQSRLLRLCEINKPMYEDLNKQLDDIISPPLELSLSISEQAKIKFNALFKN